MMSKHRAITKAIQQFYRTTTLHGFKYLCSKYFSDRFGWLICCLTSACCAGMLCAVLWARFQQVPALLTSQELRRQSATFQMPLVAICPTAEMIAHLFARHLVIRNSAAMKLPTILNHVLRKKATSEEQLMVLQDTLAMNNLSLAEALIKVMPPCHHLILNCRWQYVNIRCEDVFKLELTQWSVCCITRPSDLNFTAPPYTRLELTRRLTLAMDCYAGSITNGCEFFTKYEGEEWMEPNPLSPGNHYNARLSFLSVMDGNPDKLIPDTCDPRKHYSRSSCLLRCKELECGCLDPMRSVRNFMLLRPCIITQLTCLRSVNLENHTCNCLPRCTKIITDLALESNEMNALHYSINDIYHSINGTTGTVLSIIIRIRESKVFVVIPTETWITLLSSLGGVFNMFLGMGLFSALEILFLIFVRLPIALRRSTEMTNALDSSNHGHTS